MYWMLGALFSFALIALLVFYLQRPSGAPATFTGRIPIGMNLGEVDYYSAALPFVDAMKYGDAWLTKSVAGHEWDTGTIAKIPTDADGYPTQLPYDVPGSGPQIVHLLLFRDLVAYPGGRYVLLYDGEGEIGARMDAAVVSQAKGRVEIDVTPSAEGVDIVVSRSNPSDHIRNLRLILPGFEATYRTQPFHPAYMARLKDMSVIRFMSWGRIDDAQSPLEHWRDRPTPTDFTQGSTRGVALEYMIDLANRLHADAWFSVPHAADDDYVRNMARLIRDTLDPHLKAYVEYSNEVWNDIFPQCRYARDRGCATSLNARGLHAGNCSDGDVHVWAGIKYQARRSAEIFHIFEHELGGVERLVRVLASQAGSDEVSTVLLESFADRSINPLGGRADALAIAPYFGYEISREIVARGEVDSISVDEVIDRCDAAMESTTAVQTAAAKRMADRHDMALIAYEGGQHLVGLGGNENDHVLMDKLVAANRSPRMRDIYRRMFDAWYGNGGGLFTAFIYIAQPSKWDAFGLLESQDQPTARAPKFQAVLDRIALLQAQRRASSDR